MSEKKYFQPIKETLEKYDDFLITSNINLDGDAVGAELAMHFILQKMHKKSTIINEDKLPEIYSFLPDSQQIYDFQSSNLPEHQYSVAIVLDSSNLDRIGKVIKFLKQPKIIINLDHHSSNENFGQINYVNPSSSSVGEIIYNLTRYIDRNILDSKIASCLFTAIMTDTGSFKYQNVNSKTFKIAADLIKKGAIAHTIANEVYNKKTHSGLILLGKALSTLKVDFSKKVAWIYITRKMMEESTAKDEDTEGIIDLITTLKNIEVSVLFRETNDQKIKVSFRSKGNFDVNKFSQKFNGGGHPGSAGCLCYAKLEEIKEKIISDLLKEI